MAHFIGLHMERVVEVLGLPEGTSERGLIDAIDRLEVEHGDIVVKGRVLEYFISATPKASGAPGGNLNNFFWLSATSPTSSTATPTAEERTSSPCQRFLSKTQLGGGGTRSSLP